MQHGAHGVSNANKLIEDMLQTTTNMLANLRSPYVARSEAIGANDFIAISDVTRAIFRRCLCMQQVSGDSTWKRQAKSRKKKHVALGRWREAQVR